MTSPQQSLSGLRVVSLALNLPGPVAAACLRDWGASVEKIEPPDGDPLAGFSPRWYEELRRGQERIRLDLKTGPGRAGLERSLVDADLLLTSSRPAALDRLGLDWPSLHRRFPRICQVALVGYASPDQGLAGHDLNYQASKGLIRPPCLPETLIADLGGAQQAVAQSLALLLARERGLGAGYAEVSLAGAAGFFAAPLFFGMCGEGTPLGGELPEYGLYRARDGWIAVSALEPHFRRRFLDLLELEEIDRNRLEERLAQRNAQEWEDQAKRLDIPLTRVRRKS